MRCPSCSNSALEGSTQCPRCGFSVDKLDRVFGAIPAIAPGLCDHAGLLKAPEAKKIRVEIGRLEQRFPQLTLSLLTNRLRPQENLNAYALWIFNKSGICSQMNQEGANHDILMMIDAANSGVAMVVGYGLEPFVGEHHLQPVIEAATPHLARGDAYEGCRAAIAELSKMLAHICSSLDKTYGIRMSEIFASETGRADAENAAPY
ncbi:MAG: TPM domain-containing protein [Verrucomicrobiales bacterium]